MKRKSKLQFKRAVNTIPVDKPILFWDTCALLDMLRIPYRVKYDINLLISYERLSAMIKRGDIVSIASSIIDIEFDNHYAGTLNELRTNVEKVKRQAKEYAGYMSDEHLKTSIIADVDRIEIEQRLLNVINEITQNTILVEGNKKLDKIAKDRVIYKIAPESVKGEYKDCYIWATFVLLMKELNPSKLSYFATTNTKDYKQKNNSQPLQQLIDDCAFNANVKATFDINRMRIDFESVLGLPHV